MSRFQCLRRFPWGSLNNFALKSKVNVYQPCSSSVTLRRTRFNFGLHHHYQLEQSRYNGTLTCSRSLMTSCQCSGKTYVHMENIHVHALFDGDPKYEKLLFHPEKVQQEISEKNISLHEVTKEFLEASLKPTLELNPLDHDCYVDLVSRIEANVAALPDAEILLILNAMKRFPFADSPKSEKYLRLWKCIDTECVTRMKSGVWNFDEIFMVDDAWYPLDLTRFTGFHWNLVKRCFRKCERLNKEQFVRFMFCLNRTRKVHDSINTYELEYNLQRLVGQMSAEELCIVSLALFKTQTPIRNAKLLEDVLDVIIKDADNLKSIGIAGASKIIRLSVKQNCEDKVWQFLDAYLNQVDRLSVSACVHLALAGTGNNVLHQELLTKIIEKVENNMDTIRLKELEKIALVVSMFNIKCDTLWDKILNELRNPNPERQIEIETYGRCLPAILHYATFQQHYPLDLIDKVLASGFQKQYFGKSLHGYQRETLCLDLTMELEVPEYSGNRLTDRARTYILKYTTFYYDPNKEKVSQYKSNIRTIASVLEEIYGPRKSFTGGFLPQFHTLEVLLCTDKNGNAVDIPEYFQKYQQHELKLIQKVENNESESALTNSNSEPALFHAFVLASKQNVIYGTNDVLGKTVVRERQLRKLGYTVHRIWRSDWIEMNDDDRKKCIQNLISSTCSNENNINVENKKLPLRS